MTMLAERDAGIEACIETDRITRFKAVESTQELIESAVAYELAELGGPREVFLGATAIELIDKHYESLIGQEWSPNLRQNAERFRGLSAKLQETLGANALHGLGIPNTESWVPGLARKTDGVIGPFRQEGHVGLYVKRTESSPSDEGRDIVTASESTGKAAVSPDQSGTLTPPVLVWNEALSIGRPSHQQPGSRYNSPQARSGSKGEGRVPNAIELEQIPVWSNEWPIKQKSPPQPSTRRVESMPAQSARRRPPSGHRDSRGESAKPDLHPESKERQSTEVGKIQEALLECLRADAIGVSNKRKLPTEVYKRLILLNERPKTGDPRKDYSEATEHATSVMQLLSGKSIKEVKDIFKQALQGSKDLGPLLQRREKRRNLFGRKKEYWELSESWVKHRKEQSKTRYDEEMNKLFPPISEFAGRMEVRPPAEEGQVLRPARSNPSESYYSQGTQTRLRSPAQFR